MFRHFTFLLILFTATRIVATPENTTCKKCHPVIFAEYQHSIHSKASIFLDPVHKAVWEKHPAKATNNYKCAKCHTPSDHQLVSGRSKLSKNEIQQTEPISCQACHTIEHISTHAKANKNHFTDRKKYFFSADKEKKGTKVVFREESHFLGMFKTKIGSPYHDIDYGNEAYYNGNACMGCHDHKQNGKGFVICDLEVVQGDSKETCISCHMPQTLGSLANQVHTATHAFHGTSIHNSDTEMLAKYIQLSLKKQTDGFTIAVKNKATHTLFPQPLRLAQLKVEIERDGKTIILPAVSFARVIGHAGKPAMPWLADSVISDTSIKAHETRDVSYQTVLKKGDTVIVEFGYYLVNPKAAERLGITDKDATGFIHLKKVRFPL